MWATLIQANRRVGLLLGLLTLWGLSGSVHPAEPEVRSLYQRMAEAAAEVSFKGTLVFSRGAEMSAFRVSHRGRQGEVEKFMVALDGQSMEIYRRGEVVVCRVDQGPPMRLTEAALPGQALPASLGNFPGYRFYRVSQAGSERQAGREARKYMVMPEDSWRYGYLLWVDAQSHLLLKSVTLDGEGRVLESTQFTSIEYAPEFAPDDFPPANWLAESQTHRLPVSGSGGRASAPTAVAADWMPDGFSAIEAAKSMSLRYTDGLASFSVFFKALPDDFFPASESRKGATSAHSRSVYSAVSGRYLLTVIGEVPLETARKVADNMVFRQ